MKKIIVSLVLLNVLSLGLLAQIAVSPEKKTSPVKKSTDVFSVKTRIFEASEGGFKVYFPIKPTKKLNKIDNPFGLTDFIIYTATSVSALYGVTYFDTPTIITEESIKKLNYDRQKDALIEGLNAKLISEQEFSTDDLSGMEYVLTNDGNTITLRTFFANQRLFRLMVISRGLTGKLSASKEKINQNLIKKFFDSFRITTIPEPETEKAELPEDFGVTIENDIFYSDFFGLSMNLPTGYSILDKEETSLIKNLGLEIAKDSFSKHKDLLENSYEKTEVLLVATKPIEFESPAVFVIGAEVSNFPVFKPESLAEFLSKEMLEPNEILSAGVQKVKIGEIDFAWFETLNTTDNTRQRLYLANVNKLVLEISMNYGSVEDLQVMLKAFRSIKVNK